MNVSERWAVRRVVAVALPAVKAAAHTRAGGSEELCILSLCPAANSRNCYGQRLCQRLCRVRAVTVRSTRECESRATVRALAAKGGSSALDCAAVPSVHCFLPTTALCAVRLLNPAFSEK